MTPTLGSALFIIRSLRALGHEALLAGGSVRDRLRGVEPKDFDIATSATPRQVREAFDSTEAVGEAFGVILVILNGAAYEVATFRADGPYSDGRRPDSVRFVSPEEDAGRRDFTVNGLFLDPDRNEVLDFVGGRVDLEKRLLRAIGDPAQRFAEDKLRVLRCIRFACQLQFDIDPATWAAAKAAAPGLEVLAAERVAAELTKLLCSPQPRRGLELMDEAGLIALLLPELLPMKGCTQPPVFHPEGDVWEHTLRVAQAVADQGPPSKALAWAGLLHDIAKPSTRTESDRIRFHGHEGAGGPMARALLQRYKLPGELVAAVETLVADHLLFNPIKEMRLATLKRLLRRDDFNDLVKLMKADCLGSHGDLELYDIAMARQAEFAALNEAQGLRPEPLIDGADLISWGYLPGPAFKDMLRMVEDEQLEGRMADKDQARAFVAAQFPDAPKAA
jgi:putative nucleotidyltransferase with HDIG domain